MPLFTFKLASLLLASLLLASLLLGGALLKEGRQKMRDLVGNRG
jgi:hypothetical protein